MSYDDGIDFPALPSLERLRLCLFQDSRHNLYAINHILPKFPSLKHLTLIVCLQFSGGDITHVDWSPLTDLLSSRRPPIEHTDLYIRTEKAGEEGSSDEVISMLSSYKNLMSLVEAGCVSIKEEKYLDVHVNGFFKS